MVSLEAGFDRNDAEEFHNFKEILKALVEEGKQRTQKGGLGELRGPRKSLFVKLHFEETCGYFQGLVGPKDNSSLTIWNSLCALKASWTQAYEAPREVRTSLSAGRVPSGLH